MNHFPKRGHNVPPQMGPQVSLSQVFSRGQRLQKADGYCPNTTSIEHVFLLKGTRKPAKAVFYDIPFHTHLRQFLPELFILSFQLCHSTRPRGTHRLPTTGTGHPVGQRPLRH